MVRDLMIDLKEKDLLFEDKSNAALPVFDVVWGNLFNSDHTVGALFCNIIIPEAYWHMVSYDDNGEMLFRFKSPYKPNTDSFRIRLVALKNGRYSLFNNIRGGFSLPVHSYALTRKLPSVISACMLPFIDMEGEFIVKLVQNNQLDILDKAYIYSSKETDISVNYSDDQAAQLLTLCAPGKSYRYPTTGVGITSYLNCVVGHTRLSDILEEQFAADNKPIQDASFDSETCDLDMLFSPENEVADKDLMDIEDLSVGFFQLFTDDFVRRNTVLSEVDDLDFIRLLNDYKTFMGIMFFQDMHTQVTRIADQVEEGKFNGQGDVIADSNYLVITATLEANTIIMFDDEDEDNIRNAPVFLINDNDESRLYTALVEQPYWVTETCHKCFILLKRATIKYMIKQSQFVAGKGLYVVPQTSANVKNMLALAQDDVTGRIIGIVSNNTNISDISLDEITQHIYAMKIND